MSLKTRLENLEKLSKGYQSHFLVQNFRIYNQKAKETEKLVKERFKKQYGREFNENKGDIEFRVVCMDDEKIKQLNLERN